MGEKGGESLLTASVWHRPLVPEGPKDRQAKRQANAAVALLRRQQGRIRERLLHFCSLASKSDTHLLPLFESGKRCVSLFAF